MFPPFVVEEYDGKFWVHTQGHYDYKNKKRIMGELAYEEPFETHDEAQMKANELEFKTGCLW